jgi:hypothetical protein
MAALKALNPNSTVCIPWGRGGGKSYFQRLAWYLTVAKWDGRRRPGAPTTGVRIVLVMPTLEQAKKVHATLMLDELSDPEKWGWLGGVVNRTEWRVTFPGGSWIQFVTAERAKNIRGLRCDFVCVDEADDVDPEILDAIVVPWFSEPHSLRMVLIGGTPTRGRHGLLYRTHRRGQEREFFDHHSFHASCYDFPKFVDPLAVEKAKRETPPALFKREWLCDFDAAEGLVYGDVFSEAYHIRAVPRGTEFSKIIIGVDWGYEDPAVMLPVGVTGSGAEIQCYALEEFYKNHQTLDTLRAAAEALHRKYPRALWYADPSRPDAIEMLRRSGIRMQGAANAIEDGILTVATMLVRRGEPGNERSRLYIAPGCKNTIREFGMYRRKRDVRNRDQILDDPEDKHNHAMDALRYAIFSHFGAQLRTYGT